MNLRTALCGLATLATACMLPLQAQVSNTGSAVGSLRVSITLPNAQTNGVAIAPGGRTFMVIARQKGQDVPQLAEYLGGQLRPYPDAAWNAWKPAMDATNAWVHANSVRFGPDGTLWVVDFGSEGLGKPEVMHGPKLVGFNISTGKVVKSYLLDAQVHKDSAVDDVRFHGDYAFLTDAGWPGIIVIHLTDGQMWRALNNDRSVTAKVPLRGEGHELKDAQGKPIFFHADQLEVSPDGLTLYEQPCSGPMYAIATSALEAQNMPDTERARHVKLFARTGTAGGTAIDSAGNVYVSDTDHDSVLKVTPAGQISTLVHDPRLVWVDAMWITPDGKLWMPAAQMDRTPSFNDGKLTVKYPMQVFTVDIGNGPPAGDHQ